MLYTQPTDNLKKLIIIIGLFCLVFLIPASKMSAQGFLSNMQQSNVQPALSLDNRFTQIMGTDVTIWGAKAGVDIDKKYHTGIGYYFLNTDMSLADYHHDLNVHGNLNMYYFTAYFDLTLFQAGRWEVRLPIDIGYGHGFFDYTGGDDVQHSQDQRLIFYEPSVSVSYNVWRWVGIGATLGDRQALLTRPVNEKDYNGLYVGLRVKISLYGLYDDFFVKKTNPDTQWVWDQK